MSSVPTTLATAIIIGAFELHAGCVKAQQTFEQTYERAFAKAHQECGALFSDHVFDPFRSKIPFGDEKPTFAMLTNTEKLKPKDRRIADLAVKALEQCRKAYAPVYAMLPPTASAMIAGVQKQQDAIIAELYRGKITFGDYNVAMDRMVGQLAAVLSGIAVPQQAARDINPINIPLPRRQPTERKAIASFNDRRLALVIGNSNYLKLPRLANPANDARSIAKVLQEMGYKTTLVLDGSEQSVRGEVRKFADESQRADVAVVYFAGHGAQLNGSNYLLPIDIDIPRTDADIQFSALKVDDLVNSIGSSTKIVFLDACRDNPVLFKNLVRGRGAPPTGLAPAVASNFDLTRPGGGVFIAYATDAGSVADDGGASHSPFTQALLRYIQKPISIDDMFSMVTKEVRLVTKNAQRPYKYASLENIICVAPNCSSNAVPNTTDVIQEAKQSESDELRIALRTKNLNALETYIQKYPDTAKRADIQDSLEELKRAEYGEWTLFEVGDLHHPWYVQMNSIQQYGSKVAAKNKYYLSEAGPRTFFGKSYPAADYIEDTSVVDCKTSKSTTAEETIFDKAGNVLFHYNFGDPKYLDPSSGVAAAPGSVNYSGYNLLCHEELRTPFVTKEQLRQTKFKTLSSTVSADGDIFYKRISDPGGREDDIKLLFIVKFFGDKIIPLLPNTSFPNIPKYRTEVDLMHLKCAEKKMRVSKSEFYDSSNEFVDVKAVDYSAEPRDWLELKEGVISPVSLLFRIVCGEEFGGIGVEVAIEDNSVKVKHVIDNMPAANAGIKVGDVIVKIDGNPSRGLSLEQVIQKLRGPANSYAELTVLRDGQERSLKLNRRTIHTRPIDQQVEK